MTGLAGGEHSLYFDKTGIIHSTGACGLGWCREFPVQKTHFGFSPVRLEQARLVYASYYHNLAVSARNQLYIWGCGTFTEEGLDGVIPALGPGIRTDRGEGPHHVTLPNQEFIAGIAAGAYHSIVWIKPSNTVYTFGAGQLGQLGRPIETSRDESGLPVDPTPKPVVGLPQTESISSISAGFYNTLVACKSGKLYCAGENQNQQCGNPDTKNLQTMTLVDGVENVKQSSGGYCHTLILDMYGKAWSMGCGDDGQRGDGKTEDDARPLATKVSLSTKATQVEAGANHSVVLGANRVAYAFGANDVGQCGVDSEEDQIVSPNPIKVDEPIAHISAGYAHTILTGESGKIYAFGQNDNGQLGVQPEDHDSPPSISVPTRVAINE